MCASFHAQNPTVAIAFLHESHFFQEADFSNTQFETSVFRNKAFPSRLTDKETASAMAPIFWTPRKMKSDFAKFQSFALV